MEPRAVIDAFDAFLRRESLSLQATIVGGSAIALLGILDRPTKDVDVLEPQLPPDVLEAAKAFANSADLSLDEDWLNNGPSQLSSILPRGWRRRVQPVYRGQALSLDTLGRPDLLKTKLFALCDRGTDRADCIALKPTTDELSEALPWVQEQDANPDWPAHVRQTLAELGRALGHGGGRGS